MKVRNWVPNELPIAEMHQLGARLSDDTVTIIQAYLGVEDFVGDYVEDGLNLLHNNRARRNLQLAWGMEELEDYRDEVLSHKWTMRENHPGLDTPLGVVCYTMVQERATYFNYDEMRKRIRAEYGYPEQSTPTERQNRVQVGAAGAFQIVGQDEIAHHGIFLEIVRIHMRYFPNETQEMLLRVFNGFTMPALHLIPDAADLEAAMRRTRLHTPRNQITEVNNPILNALGITNKKALERAVQAAKMLPGQLGPEHTVLSQSGEWVLSMTPDDAVKTESVAD